MRRWWFKARTSGSTDAEPSWSEPPGLRDIIRHDRKFRFLLVMLAAAGCLLALAFLRWVPGHTWPDGRKWRMRGHWAARAWWHDSQMGEPGTPGFRPDSDRWLKRAGWDPADPVPIRGYLESLASKVSVNGQELTNGLRWGTWLFRVAATNARDVGLVFRVVSGSEHAAALVDDVATWAPHLDRDGRLWWGRFAADQGRWDLVESLLRHGGMEGDPASLAWAAGWGPASGSRTAMDRLEGAARRPGDEGIQATRLLIQVHAKRLDGDGCDRSLSRLAELGGMRVMDQVRVAAAWVQVGSGSRGRAILDRLGTPSEPREVSAAAQALGSVGDRSGVVRILKQGLQKWDEPSWWIQLSEAQWRMSDWIGLRATSELLRGRGGVGASVLGWRLEAVSLKALGREIESNEAWKRGAGAQGLDPDLAWAWASRMADWGHVREVGDWIRAAETSRGGDPAYWRMRTRLAHAEGNATELLEAVVRYRALDPLNPDAVNNHAAALLVLEADPAEALRLLRMEGVRGRMGLAGRINEAVALVRLERWAEAEAHLALLDAEVTVGPERTMVCLGRFEMHARRSRVQAAMQAYREIDARHLMPLQVRWLEAEYRRLVSPGNGGPEGRKP